MTMTDLRSYTQAAEQDRASWLGIMVIYSVVDTLVKHEVLAEKMREGGLDDYIPPAPADENVWRRVFTDGVRRTIKTPTDDDAEACERLMVRQLSRKKGEVIKRIVVEKVDVKGQRLGYEELLEASFDGDNPHMTNLRTVGPWHGEAWDLANKLRDEYWDERGCVDGQAIRTIVRDVLEGTRATALRPGGGCYFVKMDHLATVEALEAAADVIPGTMVHTLPIIDTEKQRSNVKRAFEFESQQELDRLLNEMRDLVRSKTEITEAKAATFARDAKKAKEKLGDYQDLLNDGIDTVDAKLEIFDQVFLRLLDQVKA